ncbi:uncharacterized protein LOC143884293 [Tasmannia lanceolata]|uniref:uncharacterized protein LOC143884293 n=1 Tax=Tasmannia lanceolata TaxID=3420 RepID=UPI004062BB87
MWKSAPCTPIKPMEKNSNPIRGDSYHVLHKLPVGDSPYVKAKHVQLVDRDPNKAISLFWTAINTGDRVDSSLKDMAVVMKQMGRAEEAVEAIKSFRHLCSHQSQEAIDNVLLDLYKKCGRIDDQIELLQHKLKLIEEGLAFGGKKMKIARSQGKRFHLSIEQERARLLGNLAWAYIQQDNYHAAEIYYRKALTIEPDKNRQCNLALCLMQTGRIAEAKSILHGIKPPVDNHAPDSYFKSYERACEILADLESNKEWINTKTEIQRCPSSPINRISNSSPVSANGDKKNRVQVPRIVSRWCDDSDEIKTGTRTYPSSHIRGFWNSPVLADGNHNHGARMSSSANRWGDDSDEIKTETQTYPSSHIKGFSNSPVLADGNHNRGARMSKSANRWGDDSDEMLIRTETLRSPSDNRGLLNTRGILNSPASAEGHQNNRSRTVKSGSKWEGKNGEEIKSEIQRNSLSLDRGLKSPAPICQDRNHGARLFRSKSRWEDDRYEEPAFSDDNPINANLSDEFPVIQSVEKQKKGGSYSQHAFGGLSRSNYLNFKQRADSMAFSNRMWADDNGVKETFSDENINSNIPVPKCRSHSQEIVCSSVSMNGKAKLASKEPTSSPQPSFHGDKKSHAVLSSTGRGIRLDYSQETVGLEAPMNRVSKLASQEPVSDSQLSINGARKGRTGLPCNGSGRGLAHSQETVSSVHVNGNSKLISQEQNTGSQLSTNGARKWSTGLPCNGSGRGWAHSQETVSSVYVNGNSKLISQEQNTGSQLSTNGACQRSTDLLCNGSGRRREVYAEEKDLVDNMNPSRQINSPIAVANSKAMPTQNLSSGLPAFINGNWNQRPEIKATGRRSWADIVEEEEELSQTDLPVSVEKWKTSHSQDPINLSKIARADNGKSWAEMVEEEEALACENLNSSSEIGSQKQLTPVPNEKQKPTYDLSVSLTTESKWDDKWNDGEAFSDENLNSNTINSHPPKHMLSQNYMETLRGRLQMVDLKGGHKATNSKTSPDSSPAFKRNQYTRRSLCFDDLKEKKGLTDYSSTLLKGSNIEDYSCLEAMGSGLNCSSMEAKPIKRRNRLRVFQEITLPDSPRD